MQVSGCALVHAGIFLLCTTDGEHVVLDGYPLLVLSRQRRQVQCGGIAVPRVGGSRLTVGNAQPAQLTIQVNVGIPEGNGEEGYR